MNCNEKLEKLEVVLRGLDTESVVSIYNSFVGHGEDTVYGMGEFNEMFADDAPWNIADAVCNGNFRPNDAYFYFSIYGAESFDYVTDEHSPIDINDLAEYVLTNGVTHGIDALNEILDEPED